MTTPLRAIGWYLVLALELTTTVMAADTDPLQAGFTDPPASARPELFWDWMHDLISKEGITHDLEAMQRVGLSGAIIMLVGEVDAGFTPTHRMPHPVRCMSPEFFDHWRFAAEEAQRLGLKLTSQCGPGWCHSGGPWIRPDQAVQKLAFTDLAVSGPQAGGRFVLATATGAAPSGTVLALPGGADFTRDVAIVALPAGQPVVGPAEVRDLSAQVRDGVLTWEVPTGNWLLRRIALRNAKAHNRVAPEGGIGFECDKFSRAANQAMFDGMVGRFLADAPHLVGRSIAGMEADSWEVGNPEWSADFTREFQARRGYDPVPWLAGHVSKATIGTEDLTKRFRYDLRLTQADVIADNFFTFLNDLCAQRGLEFMTEGYYGPFDPVRCDGRTARPMGEFWASGDCIQTVRWAASAATAYGRKRVGAEAFTGRWSDGAWSMDPYALKRIGDLAFCYGVNHLTMHGSALQPWGDRARPGMTMGFWGTMFGPGQTWWEPGRAWVSYLSRCQFLLQQGHQVADILAVFPALDWQGALPSGLHQQHNYDLCSEEILLQSTVRDGRIVLPAADPGYRVLLLPPLREGANPALLRHLLTLARAGATVVCSDRPTRAVGLQGYPGSEGEVLRLTEELWGPCDGKTVREHVVGAGRLCWIPWGTETTDPETAWIGAHRPSPAFYNRPAHTVRWSEDLRNLLTRLGTGPDVQVRTTGGPAQVWGGRTATTCGERRNEDAVAWIHRRVDGRDVYFLASQVAGPMTAEVDFRIATGIPTVWDPQTGTMAACPRWRREGGITTIPLTFTPFGSCFVVFGPGATDPIASVTNAVRDGAPATVEADGPQVRVAAGAAGTWEVRYASGRVVPVTLPPPPADLTIPGPGPWTVTFPPRSGAPAEAQLDTGSWTGSSDPGIRYFSGTATYRHDVDLPTGSLTQGTAWDLDLGAVANLAEVRINGQDAGILWKPPFRCDITRLLHEGRNAIEIRVTNLWVNRLVGDEQLPDDCTWMAPRTQCHDPAGRSIQDIPDWVWTGAPRPQPGRVAFPVWKFYDRTTPLLDAGLLGPVALRARSIAPLPAGAQDPP